MRGKGPGGLMRSAGFGILVGALAPVAVLGAAPATQAKVGATSRPATLQEVLAAGRDLWGEAAMGRPEEVGYESFAGLLPPLRYVNAAFRHYPIVLSAPNHPVKARLTSNGSSINAKANLWSWYEVGCPVVFHVGSDGKAFGENLRMLDGPRYAQGYLPIVQMSYRSEDATYGQEVFAGVEEPFAGQAAVFVRFRVSGGKQGKVFAQLGTEATWEAKEGLLRDKDGRAWVWADSGWQWDAQGKRLTATMGDKGTAVLTVFSKPAGPAPTARLSGEVYDGQRQRCVRAWEELLASGMKLEVPEAMVNNAWRAMVAGNYLLTKGDILCYSAGNHYERQYEAECGDAVRALLMYGYAGDARKMTVPLLDYVQKGLAFHDAAFKLQLLAHYYWLTRDGTFVEAQRPRWTRETERIIKGREPASGLLPQENYCGDIHTQVYSLNSNANTWRGLRDMAAVLTAMGKREEARPLIEVAGQFRAAILAAVEKSERRDFKPPFIPIALFGAEKPYETLTASRMGSYWDLMIPYVLGSGVFGDESERVQWILDTLHQRGGVCMGMIRFQQHRGLFANENGLDDLYGLRYVVTLLRRDEVERALVSFYGKLSHGVTRDTFIGAEGTSLVPLDAFGRPLYLPPTCSSNALFLWNLRYLLIQDWDVDDDGRPDTLRLFFATPRRWLADGSAVTVERAPTAFGEMSAKLTSRLSQGEVLAEIAAPAEAPKRMLLRARLPGGWAAVSGGVGDATLPVDRNGTVDLTGRSGQFTVRLAVQRTPSGQ